MRSSNGKSPAASRWIATAAETARSAVGKARKKPSPVWSTTAAALTGRRCRRTSSSWRRSSFCQLASPWCSRWRVESTMSVKTNVIVTRVPTSRPRRASTFAASMRAPSWSKTEPACASSCIAPSESPVAAYARASRDAGAARLVACVRVLPEPKRPAQRAHGARCVVRGRGRRIPRRPRRPPAAPANRSALRSPRARRPPPLRRRPRSAAAAISTKAGRSRARAQRWQVVGERAPDRGERSRRASRGRGGAASGRARGRGRARPPGRTPPRPSRGRPGAAAPPRPPHSRQRRCEAPTWRAAGWPRMRPSRRPRACPRGASPPPG